jgi:hypothetical protein
MSKYKTNQKTTDVDSITNQLVSNHSGLKIDVDPEYQRGVVWDDDKMAMFIDSIMKGIAPFPILLCQNLERSGKICIDGKQRLTSLLRFKENKLKWDNKKFRDLTPNEQMDFLNCSIHIIEYGPLDYEDQKEIFSRIQYGVALSEGEKILSYFDQDTVTKFRKFCDTLFDEKLSKYKSVKSERDGHYHFMSHVLMIIVNDSYEFSKKSLKSLNDDFKNNEKKLKELFDLSFSSKLLLNDKMLEPRKEDSKKKEAYRNIPLNRLLVIMNMIYKEKFTKKSPQEKYNEMIDLIIKFYQKAKEKDKEEKYGSTRSVPVLNKLEKLYTSIKNNESDKEESDSDEDDENEHQKIIEKESVISPPKKKKE